MQGARDASHRVHRLAVIDDHEVVHLVVADVVRHLPDVQLVALARSVDEFLRADRRADLVLLDLRLGDGSGPTSNIRRLRSAGSEVLVLTSGESPYLLREALQGEVLGVVRKSEPMGSIVRAVALALLGRPVVTAEWAHAVASDPAIRDAKLSAQEARVLARFADGARAQEVAEELHITVGTLEHYVRRIRSKYARAGRPATSKVDLYKRAVEDGLLPEPTAVRRS